MVEAMKYLINTRLGVVHAADCPTVRRISPANLTEWDPIKAHLAPGVQHCPACLSHVPEVPRNRLLEDADGAPYPDEVQNLMRLLTINAHTFGGDAAVAAFEAMRLAGIRQALAAAVDAVPVNMELRPNGSTDPQAAMYVEGAHDVWAAINALLPRDPDAEAEANPWD